MTEKPTENVYLNARQEWNERYGTYIRASRLWCTIAFMGIAGTIANGSYALFLSSQVKLVPHIVEVDKLGNARSIGLAEEIDYADPRVVRATLGSFFVHLRSVTPDTRVQNQYIDHVFSMLLESNPATERIKNFYRNNTPAQRAKTKTVSVEVISIVAQSTETYLVDWREIEFDHKGKETDNSRYRASVTIALLPPQNEEIIRLNPIGLYIEQIDWNVQL